MAPMRARATTPPATPPAIAPVFDDDFPEGLLEPELEEMEVPEVGAPATREAVEIVAVACPMAVVPGIEVETELPPITEPASTSGESREKSRMA